MKQQDPKMHDMGRKINKILGTIGLVLLVGGVAVMFYKQHQFMENYRFTIGRVTEINGPGWKSSGDYSVMFEYWVNKKVYRNNENYNYCGALGMSKIKSLLVGRQFPVAYSVNDPNTSTMLITLKNAERFKYQLPDSLRPYDSVLICK